MDFPNKGIVQTPEGDVVVKNALPGDTIEFRINKIRKGKAEGQLLRVIDSCREQGPTCSFFGVCGGCTSLSMTYEEQLRMKEEQIKRLIRPVLEAQEKECRVDPIQGSPKAYEYRNKMEFSFGDSAKDGPLELGMHRRGSFYDVVTVSDCRIVDGDYRAILTATRDYFGGRGITYYHKNSHEGYLRHLLVRKASRTGEILVALVTTSQTDSGVREDALLAEYRDMLLGLPLQGSYAGIAHIVNDALSDAVLCDRMEMLYGQDWFYEELLGLRFRISTFSFFQTNSYSAEVLYDTVRSYVKEAQEGYEEKTGKKPVVFDLYSGTGTIAQLIAPVADAVVGVEIVEEAVEAARKNAAENGLENCTFIAGDVLKVIDTLESKPDLIILDPPRDGIHPKALPKILSYGVDYIIYVSCKPTSFVRDMEMIHAAGYQAVRIGCVDQFPWTANTEVCCLLERL